MEEYKVIPGFEMYTISIEGVVKNINTNRVLRSNYLGNSGYYQVHLRKDGKCVNKSIHRLLAETFIPNPKNLRTVNHINGDKLDNRIENLEWADDCTQQHHACLHGLKPTTKHILTEEEIIEVYRKYSCGRSMYSLAKEYGTRKQQIAKLVHGERHIKLFGQYREKFNL